MASAPDPSQLVIVGSEQRVVLLGQEEPVAGRAVLAPDPGGLADAEHLAVLYAVAVRQHVGGDVEQGVPGAGQPSPGRVHHRPVAVVERAVRRLRRRTPRTVADVTAGVGRGHRAVDVSDGVTKNEVSPETVWITTLGVPAGVLCGGVVSSGAMATVPLGV